MNKSEINEIKKQLTPDLCTIDRICGCYVTHEKKKRFVHAEAFGRVRDEEMYKYLEIFRHTLSGTRGKHLTDLSFPLESEQKGGTQDFLMQLRASGLHDDILLDMFYDRVIESFDYGENYYIILVHAVYDIPLVTSDNLRSDDASDNVYEYILCAICPVKLSKAALGYNEEKNLIEDRFRDWVVDMPVTGFLFPAFADRTADIHRMLYYTKKPEELQPAFIAEMFGAQDTLSAPAQQEGFLRVVRQTLGDEGDYETTRSIHETLHRMIEEHDDTEEQLTLDKKEVKRLLEDSGVEQERLSGFDKHYREAFGRDNCDLVAANIANMRRFELKTPDVRVIVNPERADLVETRVIGGRQCLVIQIDDRVEVNGIDVRTISR